MVEWPDGTKYQLGLEPTPQMFVDHLIEIFREIKRVLKSYGNVFVVIDDSYAGSQGWKGGGGLSYKEGEWERGWVKGVTVPEPPTAKFRGAPRKSMALVPEMFTLRMVYEERWILRQKIIWTKKMLDYELYETVGNAMPESARDRQPHNWEYVYHFVKNPKYYYDQDAVRVLYTKPLNRWGGEKLVAKGRSTWDEGTGQNTYRDRNMRPNPLGANAPDFIQINTEPLKESHYASFPTQLVQFLIKVGCPEQICKKCGKPISVNRNRNLKIKYDKIKYNVKDIWGISPATTGNPDIPSARGMREKILKSPYLTDREKQRALKALEQTLYEFLEGKIINFRVRIRGEKPAQGNSEKISGRARELQERGFYITKVPVSYKSNWTDCGCGAGWDSGVVLDPFLGSGTTSLVALKMGRRFVGVEINRDYCNLALKRIKPYLSQKRLGEFLKH